MTDVTSNAAIRDYLEALATGADVLPDEVAVPLVARVRAELEAALDGVDLTGAKGRSRIDAELQRLGAPSVLVARAAPDRVFVEGGSSGKRLAVQPPAGENLADW